jgi:sugar phosphate permease
MFIPGLIVALLVKFCTSEKPSLSKHISAEEIALIEENTGNDEQAKSMTFGELLKHSTVWQLTLGFFCYSIASTGFINWLPTYLISGRGFTTLKMGFAMALILLASVLGLSIGGFITDKFFKNNRKVPFFIFMALGAGFFYLTIIAVSSSIAVTFMTIAVFLLAIACAAYWTIPLTVLPKEVFGAASATVNLGGMIAGFITPMVIGFIVQASGNNYNYIFFTLITACILSIIAIVPIRSGQILQSVK